MGGEERRATAIDYATEEDTAAGLSSADRQEIARTIAELVEEFGIRVINEALADHQLKKGADAPEAVNRALRSFCVLLYDSDLPQLTAILVGKLAGLETVTGRRLSYRELGDKYGIGKQAVANRLKTYARRLDLPRPYSTTANHERHRLTNRRNHGKRSA